MKQSWSDSKLSALFDAEIDAQTMAVAQASDAFDEAALDRWLSYQVVRDSCQFGQVSTSKDFIAKLRSRMGGMESEPRAQVLEFAEMRGLHQAVNDSLFRWKTVAGVSCCITAGVLAWLSLGGAQETDQLAKIQTPVAAQSMFASPYPRLDTNRIGFAEVILEDAGEAGEVVRDPDLDDLLRAHGAVAASHSANFFRSATFRHEGL